MSRGHESRINRIEYVEHLLLRGPEFQFPMLVKGGRSCELGSCLNKIADELIGSMSERERKIDEAKSRIDIDKITPSLSKDLKYMGKRYFYRENYAMDD